MSGKPPGKGFARARRTENLDPAVGEDDLLVCGREKGKLHIDRET